MKRKKDVNNTINLSEKRPCNIHILKHTLDSEFLVRQNFDRQLLCENDSAPYTDD